MTAVPLMKVSLHSQHLCPCCRQPLRKMTGDEGMVTLWCPYGPCESQAASNGATAFTEWAAFCLIESACEEEGSMT